MCAYNSSRCVLERQRKPARIRDAVAVYSPSIQPAERRGNNPVKPRSAYAERHSVCDGLRLPGPSPPRVGSRAGYRHQVPV